MRRVLIISYHFPPVNNINARRWGEMVKYMPQCGWEPYVLTTKSQGELPVALPEEHIIRLGENYYSRRGTMTQEEGYRGIPKLLWPLYALYRLLGVEINSIDRFIFEWYKEVEGNIDKIKKINPDLIIGSCYPPAGIWMARELSEVLEKPWIADLQDTLSLFNNSNFLIKRLDNLLDRYAVKTAQEIITISPYLAKKMEKLYKRPVKVIYNAFD